MNSIALAILVSHVLAAEPATAPAAAEDPALRAAVAAEKAALAAEKAADSAAKAAEAATKIADRASPAAVPAAAAAAPAAEEKKAEPPKASWTGTASLSVLSLTGNARSISFTGGAAVERKSDSWILGMKAAGSYGQAMVSGGDEWQTVALNASFQARGAFRFTPRYSAFLIGGIDMDHVASIEERPYGEAGVGILWLDEKEGELSKLVLNTDVAFRVGHEFRYQYFPTRAPLDGQSIIAPRLGLAFRYALTKDVIFTENAEALPIVVGETRVLVNSVTKISARIVAPVSISLGFEVRYDSLPAPGKENTDTALSFGIEAGF